MKLSRKFLSDYLDINVDNHELAEKMTSVGNEYDSEGKIVEATSLTIGKVLECIPHPDSDHLHVCKVDVGEEVLQIVCGAPNVREGIKVIVALPGATLPGGTIKKGNIRGVESNGMLCSIEELGLDKKYLKPEDIEGIKELDEDAVVGSDPLKYLELDDEYIDFELTSNRGDLLSIIGMAHEIGAIYNLKVKDIDTKYNEIEEDVNDSFELKVETENCPLFLVKRVNNVEIKPSPLWMQRRLMACGIRPINNVVDISNYVMLETGQPLHYYDADKLNNKITVRMAHNDEKLTTLDNIERTLSENDIVITDGTSPVGLAGVMGGLTTEVEEDTKNIIIEAAIFDNVKIRKTAKKILRSEASNRFEKGINPENTYLAIKRSCALLEKYANATITKGIVEYKNLEIKEKEIDVTFTKINKVLGLEIPQNETLDILNRLGFKTEVNEDNIHVTVPTRRLDISIKEDIIEEVGRMYGLDKIPSKMPTADIKPGHYNKNLRDLKDKLVSLGLNETISYALIPEKEVKKYTTDNFEYIKVNDPMSEERSTLRYSLLYSLKEIYEYNKARNQKDICIFEVGKSFYKENNEYKEDYKLGILMTGKYYEGMDTENVDFYIIKGVMEELFAYLGYENRYYLKKEDLPKELHPGQSASIYINNKKIGVIGLLHPQVTKDNIYVLEINIDYLFENKTGKIKAKEISKYPSIVKDLALVVTKDKTSEEIINAIKKSGGRLLTDIKLFDIYEGENIGLENKSMAYSLIFQDPTRTLSDEEINQLFNKIIKESCEKLNATLRG